MKYLTYYSKITLADDNGKELARITFPEREKGIYEIKQIFVDESLRGQGIAQNLLRHAINEINFRGGTIIASCSYAKNYIEKYGLRPAVICHMMTSIDGKVTGEFLSSKSGLSAVDEYYRIHHELDADAFACGRITMESSFTNAFQPDLTPFKKTTVPYDDFVAKHHKHYAVSFDRMGSVGWTDSEIHDNDPGYNNRHIIEVLTERTPMAYLAYLRSIGVSYIFAGEREMDITLALRKLYALFGIKKLLLEGGSVLNGVFAKAGVIDNLSLVAAPVIANANDLPLFNNGIMQSYRLISAEQLQNGALWLQYCWS